MFDGRFGPSYLSDLNSLKQMIQRARLMSPAQHRNDDIRPHYFLQMVLIISLVIYLFYVFGIDKLTPYDIVMKSRKGARNAREVLDSK